NSTRSALARSTESWIRASAMALTHVSPHNTVVAMRTAHATSRPVDEPSHARSHISPTTAPPNAAQPKANGKRKYSKVTGQGRYTMSQPAIQRPAEIKSRREATGSPISNQQPTASSGSRKAKSRINQAETRNNAIPIVATSTEYALVYQPWPSGNGAECHRSPANTTAAATLSRAYVPANRPHARSRRVSGESQPREIGIITTLVSFVA